MPKKSDYSFESWSRRISSGIGRNTTFGIIDKMSCILEYFTYDCSKKCPSKDNEYNTQGESSFVCLSMDDSIIHETNPKSSYFDLL